MSRAEIENGFHGTIITLTDNWLHAIPLPSGPIKYLEIGAFFGANICSILKTYARTEGSEVHCVDPWIAYNMYPEYQGEGVMQNVYASFMKNMGQLPNSDASKVHIHRGFSADILPKFSDDYFDIIYIDGNHEASNVLEDAVLSHKRLKPGGWLIFDDLSPNWPGVETGLNSFMHAYKSHYDSPVAIRGDQVFLHKKAVIPIPARIN
jgi:hypothetical protein